MLRRGPQRPVIFGPLHTPKLLTQSDQSLYVNTYRTVPGSVFQGSATLLPQGGGPNVFKFLLPSPLMPIWYDLTQSDQIWVVIHMGQQCVSRGQPRGHAPSEGAGLQRPEIIGTSYMRADSMRNNNQVSIKLDVRKIFTGQTMNADTQSACGS